MTCSHSACSKFLQFADEHCYRCHYSKTCPRFGSIEEAFYTGSDDDAALAILTCNKFEIKRPSKTSVFKAEIEARRLRREEKKRLQKEAKEAKAKAKEAKHREVFGKKKFCPCGNQIIKRFACEQKRAKYCSEECSAKYSKNKSYQRLVNKRLRKRLLTTGNESGT